MTDKTVVKELMLSDISFRDYLAAEAMNAMITTAATPVLTSMAELENHIAINSEEYAHKEHRKWQMN
ncbi:hypothetical protein [Providencia sp. SP181]|uniref:hypothetical protein n=1 Tax=Providencia sp. SP181 TaxID=3136277 RepID=UPI003D287A07